MAEIDFWLIRVFNGPIQHIQTANISHAIEQIHQELLDDTDSLLAAVTHLRIMIKKGDLPAASISDLAQAYHNRWPKCLQFSLILADTLMCTGESEKAVALLHQAVVNDVTGQVPERLWGPNHSYRSLWPDRLEITAQGLTAPQNIPIPAKVSSEMGWNLLPQGSLTDPNVPQPSVKLDITENPLINDETLIPTPPPPYSRPTRPR